MFPPSSDLPASSPSSGPVATAQSGPILVIEDDFVLRGALAITLQSEGYAVECAANALDAFRRLDRAPRPSLILLDIMLPYMDGLEFRALQRANPAISDIPVIVLTAVGVRPQAAEELGLGPVFFKPVDKRRLLAAIRALRADGRLTPGPR